MGGERAKLQPLLETEGVKVLGADNQPDLEASRGDAKGGLPASGSESIRAGTS